MTSIRSFRGNRLVNAGGHLRAPGTERAPKPIHEQEETGIDRHHRCQADAQAFALAC